MQPVMLVASGVISAYIFILVFRVLVSWFTGTHYGRVWDILRLVTDPWLRIFRGVRFLRKGVIDFTPILSILVLQIAAFILRYIATAPVITVISIIAAVALAVWHTIFFILVFFALLAFFRILCILFLKRPSIHFFHVVDSVLQPMAAIVARCFPRGRDLGYFQVLIIALVILASICILGFFFIEPSLFVLLGW